MKKLIFLSFPGKAIRKSLLIVIALLIVTNVCSQVADTVAVKPKTRWGVKIGLNVSTVNFSNSSSSVSLESTVGAVAGITLECPFTPQWFFHSGLEVSMKGFEYGSGSSTSLKSTAIFAQLPASVGYKFNIGKGWKLEPRLGLYLAYGIGGKTSATASGQSGSANTFGDKILQPFDAGGLFGAFVDNGQFVIGIQGESGFVKANGDSFQVTGADAHNYNFSISLGYLF